MAVLLNDAELFAMRGLPHAAVCLYLAIRQCMDMATGMVGIRSLISWQALRESLYIEPAPGRTESGSMHESTLRRLAGVLERAGLLKNCSNSTNRQLIFKCIHATNDKSAQNKPDRQPDRPRQPAKPETARVLEFKQPEPDRQPDTHPSLVIYSVDKLSSSNRVISGEPETDDDDQVKEITNPLIYPPRCEEWQREKMRVALRDIPRNDAQMILDEVAGRMRAGKVERPVGYFGKVLENYLRGDFVGELAAGEQRIREQRKAEAERRRAEAEKPVYQKSESGFAAFKASLTKDGILKQRGVEA